MKTTVRGTLIALGPVEFSSQNGRHHPSIQQACQGIMKSQELQFFMGRDIGDAQRKFQSEPFQKGCIHSGLEACRFEVRLIEAADDLAVQRNGGHRHRFNEIFVVLREQLEIGF